MAFVIVGQLKKGAFEKRASVCTIDNSYQMNKVNDLEGLFNNPTVAILTGAIDSGQDATRPRVGCIMIPGLTLHITQRVNSSR